MRQLIAEMERRDRNGEPPAILLAIDELRPAANRGQVSKRRSRLAQRGRVLELSRSLTQKPTAVGQ